MEDYTIDPVTWYSNRKLNHAPPHFVVANTRLTLASERWILDNLRGRYSVAEREDDDSEQNTFLLIMTDDFPAFEDPKEALMYELRWS